jgi:hypothetical protein
MSVLLIVKPNQGSAFFAPIWSTLGQKPHPRLSSVVTASIRSRMLNVPWGRHVLPPYGPRAITRRGAHKFHQFRIAGQKNWVGNDIVALDELPLECPRGACEGIRAASGVAFATGPAGRAPRGPIAPHLPQRPLLYIAMISPRRCGACRRCRSADCRRSTGVSGWSVF